MGILSSIKSLFGSGEKQVSAEPKSEPVVEPVKYNVFDLTAETFRSQIMDFIENPEEWKYKGNRPAVIDFYAMWCSPCRAVAPIIASLADEYEGRVDFYKVDVDREQELAAIFEIRSIPSLLFIPKEGEPWTQIGAMNRRDIDNIIRRELL